jgi:hypothetical protein
MSRPPSIPVEVVREIRTWWRRYTAMPKPRDMRAKHGISDSALRQIAAGMYRKDVA